jgi:hypothetical protein
LKYALGLTIVCALVVGTPAARVAACPECDAAAAGMADEGKGHGPTSTEPTFARLTPPDERTGPGAAAPALNGDADAPGKRWSFNLGADVPSAYFFRGYLQQDEGFIVQPFLNLGYTIYQDDTWRVRPYVGWWNSIHDSPNGGTRGGHGPTPSYRSSRCSTAATATARAGTSR